MKQESLTCPVRNEIYGGLPSEGGISPNKEFAIGLSRIFEAAHCILGSLGRHLGRDKNNFASMIRIEEGHIIEELEIIEYCIKEYSRPIYRKALLPSYLEDYKPEWRAKVKEGSRLQIHSLKEELPQLIQLTKDLSKRFALSQRDNPAPSDWVNLAGSTYLFVSALAEAALASIDAWPDSIQNPFSDGEVTRWFGKMKIYWSKLSKKNPLTTLAHSLTRLGLKAEANKVLLIKSAWINEAQIKLIEHEGWIEAILVGRIEGEEHTFGSAKAYLQEHIKGNLEGKLWVIHSGLERGYRGLRYGQDLYLTLIRWASESGNFIASGPYSYSPSKDARALHQRLAVLPGIQTEWLFVNREGEPSWVEEEAKAEADRGNNFLIFKMVGPLPISIPVEVIEEGETKEDKAEKELKDLVANIDNQIRSWRKEEMEKRYKEIKEKALSLFPDNYFDPSQHSNFNDFIEKHQTKAQREVFVEAMNRRAKMMNELKPLFDERSEERLRRENIFYEREKRVMKSRGLVDDNSLQRTASEEKRKKKLYHLSSAEFTSFKQQELGLGYVLDIGFHFGTKTTALAAASYLYNRGSINKGDKVYLYELDVDVGRPLTLDENQRGSWSMSHILRAIFEGGPSGEPLPAAGITDDELDAYYGQNKDGEEIDEGVYLPDGTNLLDPSLSAEEKRIGFYYWLKEHGFDSIKYDNVYEGGGESFIIFNPKQVTIKSITPYVYEG